MINYDELVKRPWRCDVTKNPVGTDTVRIGYVCECQGCRADDAITRLQADLKEAVEALSEIRSQANGHKRSIAYNQGVNIALENIENISAAIVAKHEGEKG